MALVKRYATSSGQVLVYDPRHKQTPLAMERKVDYFGFELEREREAVHEFPAGHGRTRRGACSRRRWPAARRGTRR